jgi:hypothetical protein
LGDGLLRRISLDASLAVVNRGGEGLLRLASRPPRHALHDLPAASVAPEVQLADPPSASLEDRPLAVPAALHGFVSRMD